MDTDLPPPVDDADPPEDWFIEWGDEPKRTLRQRITEWTGRH